MTLQPIPSSLYSPPSPTVKPPVETRPQLLPFDELSWKDFERLCLRLVQSEGDVEGARLYGEQGDSQEGIDLFGRPHSSDKYRVYQCKNVANFVPSLIRAAVKEFREGEWVTRADQFVLCTRESLEGTGQTDTIRKQGEILRSQGVELVPWDGVMLSEKLKSRHELVDDFFGRAWVEIFCGNDAAKQLDQRRRLDGSEVLQWRSKLGAFYSSWFYCHDPGLPGDPFGSLTPDSITLRYVFPDIAIKSDSNQSVSEVPAHNSDSPGQVRTENRSSFPDEANPQGTRSTGGPTIIRQSFHRWLAGVSHGVILGDPGSGKSTLLRFVALDLLSDTPRLGELAAQWGDRLPVWIPFGWWTKKLHESPSEDCSLEKLLESWLTNLNAAHLWPLVEQALGDERLLLLVDGLDEWASEDTARVALRTLQVFLDLRPSIPAVLTSRPHGFDRLHMAGSGWQFGQLADFTLDQCRQLALYWFEQWARTRPDAEILSTLPAERMETDSDLEQARAIWAQTQANEFITALEDAPDLRDLSRVPLLLCLLIAFRTQNTHLPTGRFDLYQKTVEYLLVTHPSRRREASWLEGRFMDLRPEELRSLFAHLALVIQKTQPSGVIEDRAAKSAVVDFLTDSEGRFAMPVREAHNIADGLLDIGDETTGLLVRKSPSHVGFFHRAFQEFLAASQLSGEDFDSQLVAVRERSSDPQWHEVLLCLFARTIRSSEISRLVQAIREDETSPDSMDTSSSFFPFDRDICGQEAAVLLAQLAFGPFAISASLAREIASRTFDRIEQSSWLPHRERLLRAVLQGLHSTSLRAIVQERVHLWFSNQTPSGRTIFNALGTWSPSPFSLVQLENPSDVSENQTANIKLWKMVFDVLYRGLHSEEIYDARAAATTMGKLWQWDASMGDRLAGRALHAVAPSVRAAALDALVESFPDHELAEIAVDRARQSLDHELQLSGIQGAISQKRHTEHDRKQLLRLPSERWGLNYLYFWTDTIPDLLIAGWPNCPKTKRACLYLLRDEVRCNSERSPSESLEDSQEAIEQHEKAKLKRKRSEQRRDLGATSHNQDWQRHLVRVLLKGYPQDDDVARWCASQIELDWWQRKHQDYERTNFLDVLHGRQWKFLAESFCNHPLVVSATDVWIDNALDHDLKGNTEWALVGRTEKAKAKLLFVDIKENGDTNRPYFDARIAFEGWGWDDPEISTVLREVVFGPPANASAIATLLPRLIGAPIECRERLLELMRSDAVNNIDRILDGLHRLRELHPPVTFSEQEDWNAIEDEVVEHSLRSRLLNSSRHGRSAVTSKLIALFPHHPLVESVAVEEVTAQAAISCVIRYYENHDLSQRALERVGFPLPIPLRRLISAQICQGSGNEAFEISLLRHYKHEFDSHLSVEMSGSFYERLRKARTAAQLGLSDDDITQMSITIQFDPRMPNAAQLNHFLAVERERVPKILKDSLERNQVATMEWTAPPYAGALVFNPDILREFKETDRIYWREKYRTPNAALAKILLTHWEEHCSLWDSPTQVARTDRIDSDFKDHEFWNNLAPFIEPFPAPRQALLEWSRNHTFDSTSENILHFLANVAPRSMLLADRCFDTLNKSYKTVAATLLGTQFRGDKDILRRLTQDGEGNPKKFYRGGEIIALCEGWPECEILAQIIDSVRRWEKNPEDDIPLGFNISTYSAHFSLVALKAKRERVANLIFTLLSQYPLPVKNSFHFDGNHILRVLERRVHADDQLAALLWSELKDTGNPSSKIILPSLLLSSTTYKEGVLQWCRDELSRQFSAHTSPEVGFDWLSFSQLPVVHTLLDLTARTNK